MTLRDKIFYPTDQSPGQMFAAWAMALSVAAYDLGNHLDGVLKQHVGQNWQARYRQQTGDWFTLTDPSFVFSLSKQSTPGWISSRFTLLQASNIKDVRKLRNEWFHFRNERSLWKLRESLSTLMQACAGWPQLEANTDLASLRTHLELFQQQPVLPSAREVQIYRALKQTKEELFQATERADAAEARIARIVDENSAAADVLVELRQQLEEAIAARLRAQDRVEALEREIDALAVPAEPNPDDLFPGDVIPGDPWPEDVPEGNRRLQLLGRPMTNIFDSAKGAFLSEEVGERAKEAAERWQQVMPLGGTITVTDAYRAAGLVNGQPTYLGRLDENPEQTRELGAPVQDFVLHRRYTLTADDVVTPDGASLVGLVPGKGRDTVQRLLDVVGVASDSGLFDEEELQAWQDGALELEITLGGHVCTYFDDERGYLTTVKPDEWFPGHLRK